VFLKENSGTIAFCLFYFMHYYDTVVLPFTFLSYFSFVIFSMNEMLMLWQQLNLREYMVAGGALEQKDEKNSKL